MKRIPKKIIVITISTIDFLLLFFLMLCGTNTGYKTQGNIILSFIYALIATPKMISSFGLDYATVIPAALQLSKIFGILFIFFCVFSPLAGVTLTVHHFFKNQVRYFLLKNKRDTYYFSELNDSTLQYAKNISKQKKKILIVFCNTKITSESIYYQDIINGNFITLKTGFIKTVKKPVRQKIYFEMGTDQETNLLNANKVILKYNSLLSKTGKKENIFENKIKFYIFYTQTFTISKLNNNQYFPIILVNPVKMSIYNLLFEHSLVEEIKNKELHILTIGTGEYSKSFTKAATWASVLDKDYTSTISVIDNNAKHFEAELKKDAPCLFNTEIIFNFYQADLSTNEFSEILDKQCQKADYIFIDTGDDNNNITQAVYLRSYYIRKDPEFKNLPFIVVKVSNSKMKHKLETIDTTDKLKFQFHAIGYPEELLSDTMLVDSPVENIEVNCCAAYCVDSSSSAYGPKKEYLRYCNSSEFEKDTNRAAAVHIKSKLYLFNLAIKPVTLETTQEEIETSRQLQEEFEEKLKDSEKMNSLMQIEHNRWQLFHYSEGWKGATVDEVEKFKKYSKNGKNWKLPIAKIHACCCTWDELDVLVKNYDSKLKEYDATFIKRIPYILGMNGNSGANVTGIRYIFVKRKDIENEL